ncbi:MAG: protoporphyrinogen oxidase [Salinibacter sp.]
MPRIGVIGAGIAGLTAAHHLHSHDVPVVVLEAHDRPGGVIQTHREAGFLVEAGPNSLRSTPFLHRLVQTLGLDDERVWADDTASRRYVRRDGRLVPVPMSIGGFLTTDLLSTSAKLRLLAEPFVRARAPERDEESLASFIRRRLGPEVLDYAVAPFVGGVYAGDPEQLSARHTFDRLVEWEQTYGSLFWGALRDGGDDGADDVPSGLFSFRKGLETLPRALADALDGAVEYGTEVTRMAEANSGWTVHADTAGGSATYELDGLVCTVPLHQLAALDLDTSADLSPLEVVSYPPVHVVALGYERSAIAHPLDGFGLLVPPVEADLDVLGTLFSSTLFPGRAPDDRALLTTFVGGARAPHLARREDAAIQSIVERDLDRLLGVEGTPVFSRHVHWPRAIPQYRPGHGAVKETLGTLETRHPSLAFAGNYRDGVAVGDAAKSGRAAAERLLAR